ncbi:THO complex subunit 3 [Morella rubra]|uniref:THO complex subunit 3 n=1 Tax=Morella rubra TaxID=262757 RepID=A0A6A1VQR1_9ROSI|nr:THO complex subunit 3 [Morella rubra]
MRSGGRRDAESEGRRVRARGSTPCTFRHWMLPFLVTLMIQWIRTDPCRCHVSVVVAVAVEEVRLIASLVFVALPLVGRSRPDDALISPLFVGKESCKQTAGTCFEPSTVKLEYMETTFSFKNLHSREYQGHKKKVLSVPLCSSPSLCVSLSMGNPRVIGTKLASGSVDQTARLWHIEPHGHGKVKDIELKGHTDSVDQLCWDPKHADLIATASGDKTVRLWDARSGKCSQLAELSGENINITYKPDGTHVAVGNRDDELTILDVRKFKPIHKRKFSYEVNEIAWNMTGEMFFLTTGNGTVEVLAYPSLQPLDTLVAHTAGCYCIARSHRKVCLEALLAVFRFSLVKMAACYPYIYFAVGSADSLVSLWDISEMLCVRTFTKLEWPVRTISFNYTGDYIASASEDLFIDISNVQTGRTVHQIPCRAPEQRGGIPSTIYLHMLGMTRTNIRLRRYLALKALNI